MQVIDEQDEALYLDSVRDIIEETRAGSDPTDALHKTAESRSLKPAEIRLVANAFNQSKACHILKSADASVRTSSFSLADPAVAIGKMFGGRDGTSQKEACRCPEGDFSRSDIIVSRIEKAASGEEEVRHVFSAQRAGKIVDGCRELLQKAAEQLSDAVAFDRDKFMTAVRKVVPDFKRLSERELKKTAQLIVNGYPRTGSQLLKVLEQSCGIPFPAVQKTAHAAVFPPTSVFLKVEDIYGHARNLRRSMEAREMLDKEAGKLLPEILSEGLAESIIPDRGLFGGVRKQLKGGDKEEQWKAEDTADALDAEFFNRLKELDRKKVFFDLILRDRDLRQYDFPDLVLAYNDTVAVVPEAADNPGVLKHLMTRFMESGGVKDVHEILQETELSSKIQRKGLEQEGEERAGREEKERKREAWRKRTQDKEVAEKDRKEKGKDRSQRAAEARARSEQAGKDRELKGKEMESREKLTRNEAQFKRELADADAALRKALQEEQSKQKALDRWTKHKAEVDKAYLEAAKLNTQDPDAAVSGRAWKMENTLGGSTPPPGVLP